MVAAVSDIELVAATQRVQPHEGRRHERVGRIGQVAVHRTAQEAAIARCVEPAGHRAIRHGRRSGLPALLTWLVPIFGARFVSLGASTTEAASAATSVAAHAVAITSSIRTLAARLWSDAAVVTRTTIAARLIAPAAIVAGTAIGSTILPLECRAFASLARRPLDALAALARTTISAVATVSTVVATTSIVTIESLPSTIGTTVAWLLRTGLLRACRSIELAALDAIHSIESLETRVQVTHVVAGIALRPIDHAGQGIAGGLSIALVSSFPACFTACFTACFGRTLCFALSRRHALIGQYAIAAGRPAATRTTRTRGSIGIAVSRTVVDRRFSHRRRGVDDRSVWSDAFARHARHARSPHWR